MYNPSSFAERDVPTLFEFIEAHPLATVVTATPEDGLIATHLPLVLNRGAGSMGVLNGHFARANPHARVAANAPAPALAMFMGADAYITPSWYQTKEETGRVVPTWNYVAVHASGSARAIDDPQWLRSFLTRLTDTNESRFALPWKITDAPEDYLDRRLKSIVGIEVAITRIAGKWKVSQNRTAKDAEGVVSGLRDQGDPAALTMADWVDARKPSS